ncbi:hypothetical protein ACEPAH_2020 [Sanghuangporus vaninii]
MGGLRGEDTSEDSLRIGDNGGRAGLPLAEMSDSPEVLAEQLAYRKEFPHRKEGASFAGKQALLGVELLPLPSQSRRSASVLLLSPSSLMDLYLSAPPVVKLPQLL